MAVNREEYIQALLANLAKYGKTMDMEGALLVGSIRRNLTQGMPVAKAVDTALSQRSYQAVVAQSVVDSVYRMAIKGYGIPLSMSVDVAAQNAIKNTLKNVPWTGDKINLSIRLHGTNKAMREAIVNTIQTSLNKQEGLKKLSMELYDGYNSGNHVIQPAELPTYLKKLHAAARSVAAGNTADMKEFEKAFGNAKSNIEKLTARNQAGTPNTNLMLTYKNLLKEAEKITKAVGKLNTEALDKAVWAAVQEKSRYHADRIARTEDARAWFDGFVLKHQNDDLIWGYRWVLSNRHKYVPFDQCDVCANADVGYGPGVYPKNKVPFIPRHPHCMCSLEPVYYDEVDTSAPFNPDGAREYIDSLSNAQKEALFGVDGAKAYKNGHDWQKLLRGWDGFKEPVSRLKPSNFAAVQGKEVASDLESWYNEIIKKEPSITKDIQRIVEDSGGTMEGLDFKIKTQDSFLRKVDADYQSAKASDADITQVQIASAMNDVIRYTGIADGKNLYNLYSGVMKQLEDADYKVIKVKNTWQDTVNPYRGVNTIIQSPDGQNFELQFHTPESFDLKQHKLHELYEEYRLITTSVARKRELLKRMLSLSVALVEPKDIDKIKNRGER